MTEERGRHNVEFRCTHAARLPDGGVPPPTCSMAVPAPRSRQSPWCPPPSGSP